MSSPCWPALFALGITVHLGCGGPTVAEDVALVRTVFSGFVYGGTERELAQRRFTDSVPQSHMPKQLQTGETYVFYLPKQEAENGAWTQVRHRLISSGAEIVRGPKSARDLLYMTVGGPLFEFRFRYKGRYGSIRNQACPN